MAGLGIDVQQAPVPQHHPGAALVLEGDGAGDVGDAAQRRVAAADHGDLGIAEHDAQSGAPLPGADLGMARGVLTGDAALVGGFVQQRQVLRGVAGDEDVAAAAAQRVAVVDGHAVRAEREPGVLEAQAVDVRRATGRGEQVVEALDLGAAVERAIRDHDADRRRGRRARAHRCRGRTPRRSCAARTRPAPDR